MKITIHKGKHRPSFLQFLLQLGLFWSNAMQRKACFYQSCKYDLNGIEDDEDVNKLFGFGFFPSHHKNSARFGWFYDQYSYQITLMAYCYVNGKRISEHLCDVKLNRVYNLKIVYGKNSYTFWVKEENETLALNTIFHDGHKRKVGYKLGLYFGGNNKAPQKMTVKISKP